jgi:hypothetical protein
VPALPEEALALRRQGEKASGVTLEKSEQQQRRRPNARKMLKSRKLDLLK